MKNATINPVISKTEAKAISATFGSVVPTMPISMLNHNDLALRQAENEASQDTEVNKLKMRIKLIDRSSELLKEDLRANWHNFGVPTTNLMYEPLPGDRGIRIGLKNHRGEVVQCNLNNNFKLKENNMFLAKDIETALEIGTLTNHNVSFHTAPSGDWDSSKWFGKVYVTLTAKKEAK